MNFIAVFVTQLRDSLKLEQTGLYTLSDLENEHCDVSVRDPKEDACNRFGAFICGYAH